MLDRSFRALMLASIALMPSLALLAPMGVTVLFALNATLALAVLARRWPDVSLPPRWAIAGVLALPCLGLVSALWSIVPHESALRALKLLLILGSGLVVVSAARTDAIPPPRAMATALLIGLGAASLLVITDYFGLYDAPDTLGNDFRPRHGLFSRGATVMALLSWVAMLALLRLGWFAVAIAMYLAVGAAIAWKLGSGSAIVVWATTATAYLAWVATRGRIRLAIAGIVALACVAAPLIAAALPSPSHTDAGKRLLPSSWSHRVMIWQFAAGKIAERPLLGWGLDTSRSIPGGRELVTWQMDPDPRDPGDRMSTVQMMPLHPHSFVLQVWLELGATGALALAVLLFLLVARVDDSDRATDGALAALVLAGVIVSNVSYGAWQSWWLATLCLAAAWATAPSPRETR